MKRQRREHTLGEALERGRNRRRFRAPAADTDGVELDPAISSGLDALGEAMEAQQWAQWAAELVDELGIGGVGSSPAELRDRIGDTLRQLEAEDL